MVPVWAAPPSTAYDVEATPDRLSAADSETVTSPLVQLLDVLLIPVVGAVRSMLTGALSAVVVLPALSLIEALAFRPLPSPVIVLLAGTALARPESASLAIQPIVTLPLYQPLALAAVAGVPDRLGAVLSMLMPVTPPGAELSALSTAVPLTAWFAPSVETTTLPPPVQLLMPDSASEQVMLTVTLELFQPAAFAAGLRVAAIVGAVLSSLTVADPLLLLPSRSAAVAVFTVPAVSAVTESVAGVGPEPTPEPASDADQLMFTLALFQPAAFSAGLSAAVTAGPVLSRVYDACPVPVGPVHWLLFLLISRDAATVTDCAPSPEPAVVRNVHVDLAV